MTPRAITSGRGLTGYGPCLVRMDVCCNDPDNGLFDHRAAMIHLPDQLLELGASDFRGPAFREHPDHIQISRRKFACGRSKEWFGNWCWNAYWLDIDEAVEMLVYVHKTGAFNCDQGEERLFNRWRWEEPFTDSDREFLARQWIKAQLGEAA